MPIVNYKNKQKIKKLLKNKKSVLVGGCFDILHFGHVTFLNNAKKYGNFLVVALESDEYIKKNKNKIPYHNLDERAYILSSIASVDLVIKLPLFNNNEDYLKLVKLISPKIIAITKNDSLLSQKKKQAKIIGGKIKTACSYIKKFSSTKAISYAPFSRN